MIYTQVLQTQLSCIEPQQNDDAAPFVLPQFSQIGAIANNKTQGSQPVKVYDAG